MKIMITNEEIEIARSLIFRSYSKNEKIILNIDIKDLSRETLVQIFFYLINNSPEANGLLHSYIQKIAKKIQNFFKEQGLDKLETIEDFQNINPSSLKEETLDLLKKLHLIPNEEN